MAAPKASLVLRNVKVNDVAGTPPFQLRVLPSGSLKVDQQYAVAVWADAGYELLSRSGSLKLVAVAKDVEVQQEAFDQVTLSDVELNDAIARYMESNGTSYEAAREIFSGSASATALLISSLGFPRHYNQSSAGSSARASYDSDKQEMDEALKAVEGDQEETFTLSGGHSITPSLPVKKIRSLKVPQDAVMLRFTADATPDMEALSKRPGHEIQDDGTIELYPELITGSDGEKTHPVLYGCVTIKYKPQSPDLYHSSGEGQEGKYAIIYQHNAVRDAIKVSSFDVSKPDAQEENIPNGSRRLILIIRDFCTDELLEGATVTISGPASGVRTADVFGQADFGFVPQGVYSVVISKSGYTTNTSDALSNDSFTLTAQQVF